MTTQVQITKIGDQFVLPLSQEMLDKLGVQNGGEVEITTSADAIVLRSLQNGERKQGFQTLKNEMFEKYEDVFKALAEGAK